MGPFQGPEVQHNRPSGPASSREATGQPATMRADGRQITGAAADLSPLVGDWSNTRSDTDHLTEIVVRERDGTLVVRAYAAASPGPIDWGEVEATAYVASGTTEAAGFRATYGGGAGRTELAANQKQGVLVIQSYTSFEDGRPSYFAREFFHR